MENSMEVPHKTENGSTMWFSNSTCGYTFKEKKTLIQKDTCTPMFIAVLFTVDKIWEQPKCPSIDE